MEGPNKSKYAGLAIDWYQEKGFDFTEELNSIFVKLCIEEDRPEIAVQRFLYKKGRIGSWSTVTSINRLLKCLLEKNDAETMVQVIKVLSPKGVPLNLQSVEILAQACQKNGSAELYNEALTFARVWIKEEDSLSEIVSRYPLPLAGDPTV